MDSALKMKAGSSQHFRDWRLKESLKYRNAFNAATREAILFVQAMAIANLDELVYNKDRPPFDKELTEELRNSWFTAIVRTGDTVRMTLTATSEHAGWLEWGTERHEIPLVDADALHWINPETGVPQSRNENSLFWPHMVSGIQATHFLENAVAEHVLEIAAIYDRALRNI